MIDITKLYEIFYSKVFVVHFKGTFIFIQAMSYIFNSFDVIIYFKLFIIFIYRKETEEELTREQERENAVKKMRAMHERLLPVFGGNMQEYVDKFEDPVKFNAIAIPVYTYN